MFFGKKLKELRLKHARMGLHNFHKAMGTTLTVIDLFNIEHGYAPPPDCGRFMAQIHAALNIPSDHEDWIELRDLRYNEPFVMQEMDEEVSVRHALMSDGSSADLKTLKKVSNHIRNVAKKHNKKAEEYNKSHK